MILMNTSHFDIIEIHIEIIKFLTTPDQNKINAITSKIPSCYSSLCADDAISAVIQCINKRTAHIFYMLRLD